VPTDLPTRAQSYFPADLEVVALFSLVSLLVSLLLARRYPAIASAFALAGRLS
jgi:hypothetical protein